MHRERNAPVDRALSLTLALLASACAATTPRAASTIAPTAPTAPPIAPPLRAVLVPSTWAFHAVARDADETQYALGGSLRARMRGDAIEFARDAPLHPITSQARDGDRWYFVTSDGALLQSEGFVGPLTRVGDTGGLRIEAGFVSTGVTATRATNGAFFIGGATLRRASGPVAEGALVDAGFVDGRFGVALRAPGQLFRTLDGGERFEPLSLGGEAAYVVHPQPDAFVLVTTGGLQRLDATGAPRPFALAPGGSLAMNDASLSESQEASLRTALQREHPLSLANRLLQGGWLMPDGRSAEFSVDQTADAGATNDRSRIQLVRYEPDGAVTSRIELPGAPCDARPFGAQWFVRCNDGNTRTLYLGDGAHPWREVHEQPLVDGNAPIAVAPDGSVAVVPGPCTADEPGPELDESERGSALTRLCFFDGTSTRTRFVRGRVELSSAHGERALLVPVGFWGELSAHAIGHRTRRGHLEGLRGDDGPQGVQVLYANEETPRELVIDAEDAVAVRAHFTADGLVCALAVTPDNRLLLAVGPPERPLRARPLPEGATSAALLDARRGVAAGPNLRLLWTTHDGGEHWERAELPLQGDPGGIALVPRPSRPGLASHDESLVSCHARFCLAGNRVVFFADPPHEPGATPPAAPTPFALYAANRAPPEDESTADVDPRRHGFQPGSYVASPPDVARELDPSRWAGAQGTVEAVRAPTPREPDRVLVRWAGLDERGFFRASARPAVLPAVSPGPIPTSRLANELAASLATSRAARAPSGGGNALSPMPRLVSRTLVLLERCVIDPGFSLPNCDLLAIPRDGAPTIVGGLRQLLRSEYADDPRITVHAALALPDGGAAVLLRLGTPSDLNRYIPALERVDLLLRLDARGHIVARRGFSWGLVPTARMLAFDGATVGLAWATAEVPTRLQFSPIDPDAPPRLWLDLQGDLRTCEPLDARPLRASGPVPSAAGTGNAEPVGQLVLSSGGYTPAVTLGMYHLRADQWSRAVLERRGTAACLRAVYFWNISLDEPAERDLLSIAHGSPVFVSSRAVPRGPGGAASAFGVDLDARGLTPLPWSLASSR